MRRLAPMLLLLAIAAGAASAIVLATAPNSNPTPSDSLWGRQMPTTQGWIDVALIVTASVLFGTAASLWLRRLRLQVAIAIVPTSAFALYLLSVIVWRLHAPASAGNL